MTLASKITLVRVAFIPLFMALMYLSGGQPGLYMWLSLAVFVIASLTDYIDGYIARKYKQVSDFGKFLDPLADKLLVISAMVMFCQWNIFPAWALMIVLTREFAVTGLRLVAVGKGKVIAAGWSGKVKTASTMIGLCVMMAFPTIRLLSQIVMLVIVVTTVYSGIEYFIQNWKCLWDEK
jgi:CDP-diacylglycerol--glycerol-3-phosphate 3-phosphatidyltransferase